MKCNYNIINILSQAYLDSLTFFCGYLRIIISIIYLNKFVKYEKSTCYIYDDCSY